MKWLPFILINVAVVTWTVILFVFAKACGLTAGL